MNNIPDIAKCSSRLHAYLFTALFAMIAAVAVPMPASAVTYTINQGEYITFSFQWVCYGGLSGPYDDSVSGTPYIGGNLSPYNGLTASLFPNPGVANVDMESLTITAANDAVAGSYPIVVDGSGNPAGPCVVYAFPQYPQTLTVVVQGPTVTINSADLVGNDITVTTKGGSGTSGTLVLTAHGASNTVTASANNGAAVGPGTYHVSLDRPNIPKDTYTTITAQWNWNATNPATATYTLSPSWVVYGLVRHTQYNTPAESACTGGTETAYVVDSNCVFTATTLNTNFAKQVYVNGTGQSSSNGILKYIGTACGAASTFPAGATKKNSFLQVSSITGSCGTALQPGVSEATYPNPKLKRECADNRLLVTSANSNQAIKSADDYCPDCRTDFNGADGHIDNYVSDQACSANAVGDLGNFWTANTNHGKH